LDGGYLRVLCRFLNLEIDKVYAIDDRVDIPAEAVREAGAEIGKRGRLIALASAVDSWELVSPGVTCIIDADWDVVFPGGPEYRSLLKSDGGSLEVYSFFPDPLQRFLDLFLGVDANAANLIHELTPALNDLYLLRGVLHRSGLGVSLPDSFATLCEVSDGVWRANIHELLSRSLGGGRATEEARAKLAAEFAEISLRMNAPSPLVIRGHDIAPLLIRRLGLKNDFAKPELLEGGMRGIVIPQDFEGTKLAEALRSRLM
jgi:hypothetical protein